MNKLKIALLSIAASVGVMTVVPSYVAVAAPVDQIEDGVDAIGGNQGGNLQDRLKDVVNLLLFVIGAIAVIMIVIGGLRYVLSNGDSSAVTSAKNTILYAVIGLVVALLAYAIVNFVLGSF